MIQKSALFLILFSIPVALFADEPKDLAIRCQISPTISGKTFETGMLKLTLSNETGAAIPADTLTITVGSRISLETTSIPFDTIAAGSSMSLVVPYRRNVNGTDDGTQLFTANMQNNTVQVID